MSDPPARRWSLLFESSSGPLLWRLLAAAGSDKSRLLTATIWLSDIATFAEMTAVWDAWGDPANPPAGAWTPIRRTARNTWHISNWR